MEGSRRKGRAKPAQARANFRRVNTEVQPLSIELRQIKKGEKRYGQIRAELEATHFGWYAMINTNTEEFVVGSSTSNVHDLFIKKFGASAPGWCTRIGVSVFASA